MSDDLHERAVPRHVAIIMDGNGRWAQQRGLPRIDGHKAGAESVSRTVEACSDLGIEYLTLYAFSTENWKRPMTEVGALMRLLGTFLDERVDELNKHGVRLNAIGELERLAAPVRRKLDKVMAATAGNARGTLTLALSYGSRAEITSALRRIVGEIAAGDLKVSEITEDTVSSHLDTAGLPDPDLVIRTAGEHRLSNFLLWQLSYAEFWVTPDCWPDFSRDHLCAAIRDYNSRDRRYGGLTDA
ncbi:MAG: isoprenyl transferase [Lentisphaeria bacterium]|nr:isoprenyl transferase [Lentisphaeria bacterium]